MREGLWQFWKCFKFNFSASFIEGLPQSVYRSTMHQRVLTFSTKKHASFESNSLINGQIIVSNPNRTGLSLVFQLNWLNIWLHWYTLKVQALQTPPCLNTWTVYWAPALYLSVSEWFLLFTKNHWTAWRKCVQPERLGWAGRVGNASIHLFIFHRKQFWRQSCKKMASPQLGNRDSQNKFARKLSKVCHSRRSSNITFLINLGEGGKKENMLYFRLPPTHSKLFFNAPISAPIGALEFGLSRIYCCSVSPSLSLWGVYQRVLREVYSHWEIVGHLSGVRRVTG